MVFLRNLKLGPKISAGYGVILTLMSVISIIVYFSIASIVDASKWVNHTYNVILNAEAVSAAMVDMETGQRGFMITGEEEYLEPFIQGQKRFDELIAKGLELTSDNPAQVARWEEIARLEDKWQSEVAEPEIKARREVAEGANAVRHFNEVSARTVGKEVFDAIRARLANLTLKFENENNEAGLQLVTLITLDLVNMETGQRGFLLSGVEASLEPFIEGKQSLETHLDQLRRLTRTSAVSNAEVNSLEAQVEEWLLKAAQPEVDARRAMNLHTLTLNDLSVMMQEGKGKFYMDSIRGVINNLIAEEERLIVQRSEEQQETSQFATYFTVFGTLAAIVLSVLISVFVIRKVVQPLKDTALAMKEISSGDGDLTVRLNEEGKDELSELTHYFNVFVNKIESLVGDIKEAVSSIMTASGEIAAGNTDLSQRTEQQASSLQETASSLEELTSAVKQNADNAQQANQVSQDASKVASEGGQKARRLVANMEEISKSSERIGEITTLIDSIAFQTNILALNAAVEAARAGEQGRGFAVVASEVRVLAQRSASAAKEIKQLISESGNTIKDGNVLVHETGNTIEQVVTAVKRVTDLMSEISAASSEQSQGIEQVNQAVIQMDDVTQQNAALVEEAAAAAESLEEQSGHLNDSVSTFKISRDLRTSGANPPKKAHAPLAAKVKNKSSHVASKSTSSGLVAAKKRSPPPPPRPQQGEDEWEEF